MKNFQHAMPERVAISWLIAKNVVDVVTSSRRTNPNAGKPNFTKKTLSLPKGTPYNGGGSAPCLPQPPPPHTELYGVSFLGTGAALGGARKASAGVVQKEVFLRRTN